MIKKFLEATTDAEKDRMIEGGQLGLQDYKKHKQVRNYDRKLIPSFLRNDLENMGIDTYNIYRPIKKFYVSILHDDVDKAKTYEEYLEFMQTLNR